MAWLTHFKDVLSLGGDELLMVLVPTPGSGLGAALAKGIPGTQLRLIVRIQGHSASKARNVRRSEWRFKVLESIERFVIRRADLVVPMGPFTRHLGISQGSSPDKAITLPFPIRWADRVEVVEPPESPNVLFVGRLEKEKGVSFLIKAMALVTEKLPGARLLIAGDGGYRSALAKIAKSERVQNEVSFLGWLEDEQLRLAYKKSRLLVLPSIWEEGLGMVLLEAGLMGRPVIASDIGGIKDVVRHGENGLLVPPGDIVSLTTAILVLLKDKELAERMGLAGARIANEYLRGRDEAVDRVRKAILELANDGDQS
ncbi:MAG: glycosyltransferase family 4 protein [Chloroflexi bacterium]|nr:glycosyltransferase family 4 protein [Chloroflexota bacterium]